MFSLTVEEHALALRTPDITSQRFTALFGGLPSQERPQSREKNVICVNQDAQPYAPSSPGESGLLFTLSNTVLLEDTREIFHLFLNRDPRQRYSSRAKQIRYLGTYKKVPIIHATVEPEEWLGLSTEVGGIFELFPPSTLLSDWLLMACCSFVKPGYSDFIVRRILTCVLRTLESLCTSGMGTHLRQKPFATGLNKTLPGGRVSERQTSKLRSILVKRWVSSINLPPTMRMTLSCQKIEFEVIKYVRYDRNIARRL